MILLDTHVLIWLILKSHKLGEKALKSIDEAFQLDSVYVSAITFWEIANLERKKKLQFSSDILSAGRELLTQGLKELPVDSQIFIQSVRLENLHGDPADRIIVATTLNGYQLLTADLRILNWSGKLDRANAHL